MINCSEGGRISDTRRVETWSIHVCWNSGIGMGWSTNMELVVS